MAHLTKPDQKSQGRIRARLRLKVQAAELLGSTVNLFVMHSTLDAAEKAIAKERTISLSTEETQRFCDLLDHPPNPNAALINAFAKHNARMALNVVHGQHDYREEETNPIWQA